MECDSDNVTDTEKYAFLLGSALRNEDTDQFISIYDSIIPQNLPDSQLESIKDKARAISELPEVGFNELVSRARNFSLAPAGSMSSTHERWTTTVSSEEEDEGVSSIRGQSLPTEAKSDTSSLYSTAKRSCESDTRRFDDDSGLCNSSKTTNSIGSLSDGSDNESHQHFDYFPSHPQVKIRSGGGLLLDYDEVHSVHSDNSSDDIISPRSDISDKTFENGVEMQTLRRSVDVDDDFSFQHVQRGSLQQQQDDFNTDDDSEDETRSYRSSYPRNTGVPMFRESTAVYKPKFDASRSHWETSSSLRHRRVDDSTASSSQQEGKLNYSRYSSYKSAGSTASSEMVKIEKNSYKNKKEPPFGRGVDQLDKVAHSITPLISGYPGDQEVENLPAARKLEVLTSEDTKKRKKRKKGIKDEPHTDENGNPVETLGLTPSSYRQMRESPSPVLGGPTSKNRHTSELSTNQYGTFPNFDQYTAHTNSEVEDGSSKSQDRRTGKIRKKREEKKEVVRSQDIQDYVGDKKSIDELLQFIDGNHAGVKKSKKLVSKTSEDIPNKANKTKHKNKDKKQKSPTPSNSIEEIEEKGDNSAQIASLEKESGGNNMGNTGGKTECENPDENVDSENVSVEKEALNNELLKQDININNKSDKNIKNDRRAKSVSNSFISSQTSVIKSEIAVEKCEKQKTKESIKAGIKKEAPASVASEKKKVEKPVTKGNNKGEKPELTNSKSDDSLVRADTSASMSVKQKNAKNKKSKPQSLQVAKDEGNSGCIEGSNKATAIPAIANEGLIDNNFIFTDLDVPLVPKEDEFRVVGKKKKKVTKEIQPNNYVNNGNNNKSFSRFYDDKRSFAPANVNNKLPQSNNISTAIESDNRMRDLSPSSFPALCSNERERQSLKDGRRNSTGDVPIPSEVLLKTQDDSDMESVKSLPATQGSRAADSLLSPRLNVSYARMAACPKPEDGDQSPGEKSPDVDPADDLDRKVWKGSPTERRHSIGSSPDGNVITSTTNSPALGLKTGSSDALVVEPIESKSDTTVYMAHGPSGHCVQQSRSDDVIVAKKEVNLMNENCKIAKQCAIVIPTVQQRSPNSLQDSYYNSNIKNIKPERGTKITSDNIEPKMNSMNIEKYSKPDHSSSINSRQYIQKSVSKTNNGSITSKKIKQQSVIFLDRRLAEAPENLGITFGFEFEPLMNTVASDKRLEKSDTNGMSCDSKEDITTLSEEPKVTFLSEDESKLIVKDVDNVTSSSSSVISKDKDISDPVPLLADDKNNAELLQKVQSQLGRLNGVVSPPSQGQSKEADCENEYEDPAIVEAQPSMENTIENSDETGLDSSRIDVESSQHNSNSVIVYYGESVATLKKDVVVPSATNGPTRYCGKVNHIVETGEPAGFFNHMDVVNFLKAEWEKVQKLEKRDPTAVKVHGMC